MSTWTNGIAAVAALVAGFAAGQASAQAVTYTEAQATQGAVGYETNCSGCHGDKGQGAEGAALIGGQFNAWRGGPAADYYDYMATLMPAAKPGSLPKDTYTVILAHILKLNGIPAGATALATPPPAGAVIPK